VSSTKIAEILMTRFIHDQFAKDYLEELLSPLGEIQSPRRVAGEVRQIDVYFVPNPTATGDRSTLGLLGKLATTTALFEPFRNPATVPEICDCLLKLLEVRGELQRETNRNSRNLSDTELPKLWIITPTASVKLLSGFGATLNTDWPNGVYLMQEYLRTGIIVIHQLPRTPETLWLRILGRGNVQKQAIDELEALPGDSQIRTNALELFYQLQENLGLNQSLAEDRELVMRLRPLFQERLAEVERLAEQRGEQRGERRGEQRGKQEGRQLVVENLLRFRFGSLDEELSAIIEPLLALPPEEFTPLLVQLSREELLARFRSPNS
jgi:hypothetical protein